VDTWRQTAMFLLLPGLCPNAGGAHPVVEFDEPHFLHFAAGLRPGILGAQEVVTLGDDESNGRIDRALLRSAAQAVECGVGEMKAVHRHAREPRAVRVQHLDHEFRERRRLLAVAFWR
jgi:hypothetical protein